MNALDILIRLIDKGIISRSDLEDLKQALIKDGYRPTAALLKERSTQ